MKSLAHAVLPTVILVGLCSDFSLALTIPVILHPSQTSVHKSSSIPSGVASPTSNVYPPDRTSDVGKIELLFVEPWVSPLPTDSVITDISPSTSTVPLPQITYGHSDPPVPTWVPVDIVPGWSLSPGYIAQLVESGKFSGFFKNLVSRHASPEDVKIIDTKGPENVKIIDTKGPQATTTTVPGYNLDDILIIDRKGPYPIPNATPPPVPPPGFNIEDILVIDRKGPNPIPNPNSKPKPRAKRDIHLRETQSGSDFKFLRIDPKAPLPLPGSHLPKTDHNLQLIDLEDDYEISGGKKSVTKDRAKDRRDAKNPTEDPNLTATATATPSLKSVAERFREPLGDEIEVTKVPSTPPEAFEPFPKVAEIIHDEPVKVGLPDVIDTLPLKTSTASSTSTSSPSPKPPAKPLAKRYYHLPGPDITNLNNHLSQPPVPPNDQFLSSHRFKPVIKWIEPNFYEDVKDKRPDGKDPNPTISTATATASPKPPAKPLAKRYQHLPYPDTWDNPVIKWLEPNFYDLKDRRPDGKNPNPTISTATATATASPNPKPPTKPLAKRYQHLPYPYSWGNPVIKGIDPNFYDDVKDKRPDGKNPNPTISTATATATATPSPKPPAKPLAKRYQHLPYPHNWVNPVIKWIEPNFYDDVRDKRTDVKDPNPKHGLKKASTSTSSSTSTPTPPPPAPVPPPPKPPVKRLRS